MRLSNGLDKCAGQLEVNLLDSWWSLSSESWSKKNSDMVCQHLECGESKDNSQHLFVKSKLSLLEWKLTCSGSHISQCSMERYPTRSRIHQNSVNIICNSMGFSILDFVFVYVWNLAHGSTVGSVAVSQLQGSWFDPEFGLLYL